MIILWILSMLVMMILGLFESILIITTGYKIKKLDMIFLGLLTFVMLFIPILGGFIGINTEEYINLSTESYWFIFALLAFGIALNGIMRKTSLVSITGGAMCFIAILQLVLFSFI